MPLPLTFEFSTKVGHEKALLKPVIVHIRQLSETYVVLREASGG